MQGIGEIRRTSSSSRENQERGRRLSSLEKDLPPTLADPFADHLEARKETARVRSGATANNTANNSAQTRHPNTASRGDPVVYVGGNRDTDSNSNSNHRVYRAWNSGSLLVRAGGEAPTGRVPRMTYIYLVGNARAGDGVEVEVLVGDEEARTVLSKSSGVTCARVPAREVYTVNNLSGDGKTAVLFWTSPSRDDDEQDADERGQPKEADKKGGKEKEEEEVGVGQDMPQPLEPLPIAARNTFSAPIEGGFTGDEEYGRK